MNEEELYRIYQAHRDTGSSHEDAMRAVELAGAGSQPDDPKLTAQKRLSGGGGSALGDFGRMAVQGATLGFADEIGGMVGGDATRDKMREKAGDLRQLAPGASALAGIAGSVALPVFAGGQAMRSGGGLLRGAVQGGVAGGAVGQLTGMGESDAATVGRRFREGLDDAAVGTVSGAALGAVPVLANAVTRTAGGRGKRLSGTLRKTSGVTDDLQAARTKGDEARRAAGALYDDFDAAHPEVKDPAVMKLLQDPRLENAVGRIENAPPNGFGATTRLPGGKFGPASYPSGSQVREVRRSLQGLADKAYKDGDSFVIPRLKGQASEFSEAAERALPELAGLDKGYAAASGFREGIDQGFKMPVNKTASDLAYELQDALPETVEGVKTGLVNRVAGDAERGTGWFGRLMKGDEDAIGVLRQMYPDEPDANKAFKRLVQEIDRERSAAAVGKNALTKLGLTAGGGVAASQLLP